MHEFYFTKNKNTIDLNRSIQNRYRYLQPATNLKSTYTSH